MILNGLFDHVVESRFKIINALKTICVNFKAFRNRCVEHDVCAGNAVCRTEHTELKLVARESKGRGAVSVRCVSEELRKNMNAELHDRLFGAVVRLVAFNSFKNLCQLIAEEDRNNCRRSFVCAESVVIACRCNRKTKKILIIVNRLDNRTKEKQELCILIGSFARSKKVYARIGCH